MIIAFIKCLQCDSPLHELIHSILTSTLYGKCCHYLHDTDKETVALEKLSSLPQIAQLVKNGMKHKHSALENLQIMWNSED